MTLTELWMRLTFPLRARQLRRDLNDEIATHVALRADQLVRGGLSAADADLAARRRFGNASRVADASRAAWGWQWIDGLGQDLRYMLRQLRRSPGFVTVSVLTVAIGIAINTAAFTIYDAVVLKPLAVRAPDEMVRIIRDDRVPQREELPFYAYATIRDDARGVTNVVATSGAQTLSAVLPGHAPDDRQAISARFVSADYFDALGIHAIAGSTFGDVNAPAAVISHAFWTRALRADKSVIGARLTVGDADVTVIGIAPRAFAGTGLPASAPDVWMPLGIQTTLMPGSDWQRDRRPHWQVLARLAAGTPLPRFSAELSALARAIPDSAGKPLALLAKHATFFQAEAGEFEVFQQASAALMLALALILVIGVVNLVNLLAARNAAREREVTVRLALGASRGRIMRQLASESLIISLVGGAVGLVLSSRIASMTRDWFVSILRSVFAGSIDLSLDLTTDWRIVAYAAVIAVGVGVCMSAWPAVRAARSDVNSVLKQGGTATSGRSAWGTRNLLLAAQIAGSLVLLAASGFLLDGASRAREVHTGFDSDHALLIAMDVPGRGGSDHADLMKRVEYHLAALPDVQSIAWSDRIPFAGTHLRTAASSAGRVTVSITSASPAFFSTLGIPVTNGRTFTQSEAEGDAPVVVISEALARLHWPGADPIGKSLPPGTIYAGPDSLRAYVVVGVVADVRSNFLSRVDVPSLYFPLPLDRNRGKFVVRTRGAPQATTRAVLATIAAVDPAMVAHTHLVALTDGPMAAQQLMAELPAVVSTALAVLGLLLATIGIYGLISQIVVRRTREIGIHLALGATSAQVIAMVVRKTLRPVMWGAVIGCAGAIGVSLLLRSMIATTDMPDLTYGGGAFNPLVFGSVVGSLAVVILAASYLPARRATVVDPTISLRAD